MSTLADITSYLLNQSWQIALVVLVIAAASHLLRNRSAHARYLLWLIVPAKCLLPALFVVPLDVLPARELPASVVTVMADAHTSPAGLAGAVANEAATMSVSRPAYNLQPAAHGGVARVAKITVRQWLGLLWLLGAILFAFAGSLKALRTGRRIRRDRKLPLVELQRVIEGYFSSLVTKSMPAVWLIEGVGQPFVWGLIRGSVYLPVNFARRHKDKDFEAVLGDELSHFLRFDAAVNLGQLVAQGMYWFHPFVWWANKIIRAEREKCCDETAVARSNADPADYSTAIVNTLIAEHEKALAVPSLAIAGPVGNIEDRVKTIMKRGRKFRRRPTFAAIFAVLLLAAFAVPTGLALTSPTNAADTVSNGKWEATDTKDNAAALPGSRVSLEDAFRDEHAFVALCEALEQARATCDEEGVLQATQKFRVLKVFTQHAPIFTFNEVNISYVFLDAADPCERVIRKGEQVIWVASPIEGGCRGIKALGETPQNLAAVARLIWGGPAVNGLQARLEVKHVTEGPQPTVTLIVRLRNVGEEPLRIAGLSAQKNSLGSCFRFEVRLGERLLSYSGPARKLLWPLPASAYIELQPGQVDSAEVVMFGRDWGLEEPFGAEVTCVFESPLESEIRDYDGKGHKPPTAPGLWTGKLHSNTVRLEKPKAAAVHARTSSQVYEVLESTVDLSKLRPQMPLAEALEQVKNAVEPPLVLIVLWNDLARNADVERSTPVNMDAVSGVRLGTALEILLASVSAGDAQIGYVVKDGVIIVATRDSLPKNFETRVYDISSMVLPSFYRGYGGSHRCGMPGAALIYSKAEDIRKVIMETIEPAGWVEYGGLGRITVVNGGRSLAISQAAKAHEQIEEHLSEMRRLAETIVSVEPRLISVPVGSTLLCAFLDEHGIEFEGFVDDPNAAYCFVDSSQAAQLRELAAEVADSGMLTAPKVNVMNGDTATLSFIRARFTSSPSGWFGVSSSPLFTGVGADFISLAVTPTISEEQNEMLLELHCALSEKAGRGDYVTEMPRADGTVVAYELAKSRLNEIWSTRTRLAVPEGKSVLISAGQFYAEKANKELFLLIQAEKLGDTNVGARPRFHFRMGNQTSLQGA